MAQIIIDGESEDLKLVLNLIKDKGLEKELSIKSDGINEENLNGIIAIDGTVNL